MSLTFMPKNTLLMPDTLSGDALSDPVPCDLKPDDGSFLARLARNFYDAWQAVDANHLADISPINPSDMDITADFQFPIPKGLTTPHESPDIKGWVYVHVQVRDSPSRQFKGTKVSMGFAPLFKYQRVQYGFLPSGEFDVRWGREDYRKMRENLAFVFSHLERPWIGTGFIEIKESESTPRGTLIEGEVTVAFTKVLSKALRQVGKSLKEYPLMTQASNQGVPPTFYASAPRRVTWKQPYLEKSEETTPGASSKRLRMSRRV